MSSETCAELNEILNPFQTEDSARWVKSSKTSKTPGQVGRKKYPQFVSAISKDIFGGSFEWDWLQKQLQL